MYEGVILFLLFKVHVKVSDASRSLGRDGFICFCFTGVLDEFITNVQTYINKLGWFNKVDHV